MSKSNAFENDLLLLIFNNTDIADIGDAAGIQGAATVGSLYLSLHTSDPGEAGTQSTNEISYTGYGRVGLARNGTNFVVTDNVMALGVNVDFGEMTAGAGGTATHFGVGVASSGAAKMVYKGTLTPNISVVNGVIPRIKATVSTITED